MTTFQDQILGTEPYEFQSNRHNTKITFYQQENQQLQEDMQDLQKVMKLNKDALRLAYQQIETQRSSISKMSQNYNKSNNSDVTNTTQPIQQNLKGQKPVEANQHLLMENSLLQEQLMRLKSERNQAQSKALIAEQIAEEAQYFHQDIVQEYEDKILELRRIIHDKEFAIQELEKQNITQEQSGQFVKTREIVTPQEATMKLHQEMENQREIIMKLTREHFQLKQSNMAYQEFNRNLMREVQKLRAVIYNPVNFANMKGFLTDQVEPIDDHLDLHNYFYTEYFQDELERDQVQERIQNKQQYQESQTLRSQQREKLSVNRSVITKKQLEGLENNLHCCFLLITKEQENNNILLAQIGELQRYNSELIDQNDIIINSNKNYQETHIHQKRELEIYKKYYYKYLDFLKNRRKNNLSSNQFNFPMNPINMNPIETYSKKNKKLDTLKSQNSSQLSKSIHQSHIQSEEVKIQGIEQFKIVQNKFLEENQNPNIQQKKKEEPEVNVSYLEEVNSVDEPRSQKKQQIEQDNMLGLQDLSEEQEDFNRDQCKMFLLKLAKDLYVNYKIGNKGITKNVLKNIEFGQQKAGLINIFRTRRSLSNPLDYISSQTSDKLQKIGLKSTLKSQKIQKHNQLRFKKILDDDVQQENSKVFVNHKQLFNDMSMIDERKSKIFRKDMRKKITIDADASFISNEDIDFQNQFLK